MFRLPATARRFPSARFGTATAALALLWSPAVAAEESYPRISGHIDIEIENDGAYRSEDPDEERNDLYTTTEPYIRTGLTPELAIHLHGVLEEVRDAEPGQSRYFQDQGMFVEDLYLEYATDRFSVSAGKQQVDFGRAWDVAPGLYGSELAEDGYEFSERIGLNGTVTARFGAFGPQTLSGGAFFADNTVLAQSWPAGRGAPSWDDGGVGNTGKPNNWSLALASDKFLKIEGLTYHLGLLHQARGKDSEMSEKGYAASLSLPVHLGSDVLVTPFVEWVRLADAGGVNGARQTYITGSAKAEWQSWNLALSHTARASRSNDADSALTDTLSQVSAGYLFDFGLSIELGWKLSNEEAIETRTMGALLSYTVEF